MNLKSLIKRDMILEFEYNMETRFGVLKDNSNKIITPDATIGLDELNCQLETRFGQKIVRMYENTIDGLKCVQNRDSDFVDWGNLEVDTKILVKTYVNDKWKKRYFAKHEYGSVYAWNEGRTSFTEEKTTQWAIAKLYKEDKQNGIYFIIS